MKARWIPITVMCAAAFSVHVALSGQKTGSVDETTAGTPSATKKANLADKQNFVEETEKKIIQYEDRLTQWKRDRDSMAKDSDQYKKLDAKISSMESKITEARDNLNMLKGAAANEWQSYRPKVTACLADLKKLAEEKVAE